MTKEFHHITVLLLHETIDQLDKSDQMAIYADDLSGAGHKVSLSKLGTWTFVCLDQDQTAIDNAKKTSGSYIERGMVTFYQG